MAQYTETIYGRLRGVDLLQRELQHKMQKIQDTIAREGVIWWHRELQKLWREYRCRPLGFNLIRWLHEYHGTLLENSICRIRVDNTDWIFPEQNTTHPSVISNEDRQRYVQVLTTMVVSRGLDQDGAAAWSSRFRTVLDADRWPIQNGKTRALRRQDVFDIGLALGAGRDQTNTLLFKTFENDSISLLRSEDLIQAYALEMGDVTRQQRDALILRYQQIAGNKPKISCDDDADHMTQDRYFEMEDVLEGLRQIADPVARETAFITWLEDQAPALDLHSRTAHRIYCNLISLLHRVLHEGIPIADPIAAIYRCCIGSHTVALLPENYDQVCQSLLYYTGGWRYLSFNKAGRMQVTQLDGRISQLLHQQESVQKNDILFICFYICACVWQGGDPDPNRLHSFIRKVNSILKFALLPTIYLGHTLDLSIAQCIMMGQYSLDYYMDLVDNVLFAEISRDVICRNLSKSPKVASGSKPRETEQSLTESQRKKLQTASQYLQLDFKGLEEVMLSQRKACSCKRIQFVFTDGAVRWTLSQDSHPTQTSLLCPIPSHLCHGVFCNSPQHNVVPLAFKGKPMTLEDFIHYFLTSIQVEITAERQSFTGKMAVLYALCVQLEKKYGKPLATRVYAKDLVKLTIQ